MSNFGRIAYSSSLHRHYAGLDLTTPDPRDESLSSVQTCRKQCKDFKHSKDSKPSPSQSHQNETAAGDIIDRQLQALASKRTSSSINTRAAPTDLRIKMSDRFLEKASTSSKPGCNKYQKPSAGKEERDTIDRILDALARKTPDNKRKANDRKS